MMMIEEDDSKGVIGIIKKEKEKVKMTLEHNKRLRSLNGSVGWLSGKLSKITKHNESFAFFLTNQTFNKKIKVLTPKIEMLIH